MRRFITLIDAIISLLHAQIIGTLHHYGPLRNSLKTQEKQETKIGLNETE